MTTQQNKKAQNALREVLSYENEKIISYPLRLSKLVKAYEGLNWTESQKKASDLTDSNQANEYVAAVREALAMQAGKENPDESTPESVLPTALKKEVKNQETAQADLPIENYMLLEDLIADMVDEEKFQEGYVALAAKRANADIAFELFHSEGTGFFAELTFYQRTKQEADIRCSLHLFVDLANEQVLPLIYTDIKGYRFVYTDQETRDFVNEKERAELDVFLNTSLRSLIKKEYSFQEYTPPVSPVSQEESQEDEEEIEDYEEEFDPEAELLAQERRQRLNLLYEQQKVLKEWDRLRNILQNLQKSINQGIPNFHSGQVQFMEAHQKIGLTADDIAWINEHKRGFLALAHIGQNGSFSDEDTRFLLGKVRRIGMRLTAAGKILIEGTSIREDMSDYPL